MGMQSDGWQEAEQAAEEAACGIGAVAANARLFGPALKAFRAVDADAFDAALKNVGALARCEAVCEWFCSKECVLICLEFCGPPPRELPTIREFAEVVVKVTSNEAALVRLVGAVEHRDAKAFQELIKELELERFCHLLCHWICGIRCRLVCDRLCPPFEQPCGDLLQEVRLAGDVIRKLAADEAAFAAAAEAALALDCEPLRAIIGKVGLIEDCFRICEWLCVWRCLVVCPRFCDFPADVAKVTDREIQSFGRALGRLAGTGALPRALAAVRNQDVEAYAAVVKEFELEPFCVQFCHWLCLRICEWFCICVCPPLFCDLTGPTGCTAEEVNTDLPAMVVPVTGTAAGGGFDHYLLEWSTNAATWHASNFEYPPIPPGNGTQGNSPVIGGLLADFNTTALDEGDYFIRLTVFSEAGTQCVAQLGFSLLKKDVRILGIDDYLTLDTNEFDPAARFVETVPALCTRPSGVYEVSFGESITIQGAAFIGGCEQKMIKSYTIDYKPGFETDPTTGGWTNIGSAGSVTYSTTYQYRDMNMRRDTSDLTAVWVPDCVVELFGHCWLYEPQARLAPSYWETRISSCQLSGLITLRLTVVDTGGVSYYDTQRVWIDNKQICAMIRIDAVPACADIRLSQFAQPPDCGVPWSLPISGIAYDEYIDDTLPLTRPNDNFDFYWVKVAKQGGAEVQIPVPGPGGTCFHGTSRVGNPGITCDPCDPANPAPAAMFGTLTSFDLRALDPDCSSAVHYVPADVDLLLPRGECCVYVFKLHVQDRTIYPGGPHWREALWPVRICNDLPPP
jgi:hypothetical protein